MITPISVKSSPVIGAPSLAAPTIDGANAQGLLTPTMANDKFILRCDVGFATEEDWIEIQRRTFNSTNKTWGSWVAVTGLGTDKDAEKMGNNFDVDTGEYLKEFRPDGDSGGFDHGIHQHRCVVFVNVKDLNGGPDRPEVASEFSDPGPMIVDRRAPYERASGKDTPPALISTNTWAPGTIATLALIMGEGGLKFSVPDNKYGIPSGAWADNDTIEFIVLQGTNPVFTQKLAPPARAFMETGNTVIFQPSDFSPLDGEIRISYLLTDESGNVSAPSAPFLMTMSLVADPVPLAPLVPLAPDATDNLINVEDYLKNLEVHILSYVNQQIGAAGDVIELFIGAQPLITLPLTVAPLVFTNVSAAFKLEYGDGPGPKTVDVKYNVFRNGVRFPSPVTSITLDLGVRGAVNPGVPGSPNTDLKPLSVIGAISTVPNVLEKVDAEEESFALIELWTKPELPTSGQFIFIEIDGKLVNESFAITNEIAGATIRVPIDWKYWKGAGNGTHKVNYYVSSSDVTPANPLENLNRSPHTDVLVKDAVITKLDAPEFKYSPTSALRGQWNCDTLLKAPVTDPQQFEGRIFVPVHKDFVVGQVLELEVVLTPGRVLPGQPTTPQKQTFQVPITAGIQTNGHEFVLPFSFLKQIKIGTISATSRSTLAGGSIGEGTVSGFPYRSVTVKLYCDKTA